MRMATPLWARSWWPQLSLSTCFPTPSPRTPYRSKFLQGFFRCVIWREPVCLSQDCCPILNTSSLYQQGFVVQFIREIPESNGHAGAFSFLVFSIITLTANMSLGSDWAVGECCLSPGLNGHAELIGRQVFHCPLALEIFTFIDVS